MSQVGPRNDVIVIEQAEGLQQLQPANSNVTKIVIGESPTERDLERELLQVGALSMLKSNFSQLSHLYLWCCDGVETLRVADRLEVLEVRRVPSLSCLESLPPELEVLVLEECVNLSSLPQPAERFPSLKVLVIKKCAQIPAEWINRFVQCCPSLEVLDLSGNPQLTSITAWPADCRRIDINQCEQLQTLPDRLPEQLRRLGLSGSVQIASLQGPDEELPASLDYLDLTFTQGLTRLPQRLPESLRSLFLFGSRITMPPASEHGSGREVNVAEQTRSYFQDVEDFGKGNVNRGKVLFLGNGAAGKTCLAECLANELRPVTKKPHSTHGVQFWNWNTTIEVENINVGTTLQLWDFGGQEIYHNTHQLFMSKGTVFVLVWNPEEDDVVHPDGRSSGDYYDSPRSLQYWLDFIHLACAPEVPKIAIVCSHRHSVDQQLIERWRNQVEEQYRSLDYFFIDSFSDGPPARHNVGQADVLQKWLQNAIGTVISQQGRAVPTYWQLAQELRDSWFPSGNEQQHTVADVKCPLLSFADFQKRLDEYIRQQCCDGQRRELRKLAAALDPSPGQPQFKLDERRTERVLRFLTHGGLLYWDPALADRQVIVGQQWALDAIYSLLRRPASEGKQKSSRYATLKQNRGRFTEELLEQLGWAQYTSEQRRLLLSFLIQTGNCFQLLSAEDALSQQAVYVSFQHLPCLQEADVNIRNVLDGNAVDDHKREFVRTYLHSAHWQVILARLGQRFGREAEYFSDAFLLQDNDDGQTILLQFLKDRISIRVTGSDAKERVDELFVALESYLPGDGTSPSQKVCGSPEKMESSTGEKTAKLKVFFSYAWDPDKNKIPEGPGYEESVDLVWDALQSETQYLDLQRDKKVLQKGQCIIEFMEQARNGDRFLLFHSHKYWLSQFCMYELCSLINQLTLRMDAVKQVLIMIQLPDSGVDTESAEYIKQWGQMKDWQHISLQQTAKFNQLDDLKASVINLFRNHLPDYLSKLDCNFIYDKDTPDALCDWVKRKIGLQPATLQE